MNYLLHKKAIAGRVTVLFALTMLIAMCTSNVMANPLKVYILAGQSNMVGHAKITTFDYMATDPVTAPILQEMQTADGTPRVCDKVWISSIEGAKNGKLTVGYGGEKNGPKIGPEFTFGIYMQKIVNEPILIIKTAWGGKSLHTDFRSPNGGAYEFNKKQLEFYVKQGKNIDQIKAEKAKATGHYYRLMMEHVKSVLKDPKKVCPAYDPSQGYELAGFVWFQGWNDMCDSRTYPDRKNPGGYDMYSTLLAQFIRDVRQDLSAPKMPFVIGVMGVGGERDQPEYFRKAMAAPAALPEFKGNVSVVLTEKYWDPVLGELAGRWDKVKAKSRALSKDKSLSKAQQKAALDKFKAEVYTPKETEMRAKGTSNAGYHYLGAAKILAQIGKAFAEALDDMADGTSGPSVSDRPAIAKFTNTYPANGKVKVFILAGQSNMVGFGQLTGKPGTMETYVQSHPKVYGHLVDKNGKHVVRDDVWIVNLSYKDAEKQGWLTTGYGASEGHIGPEYGFGFAVGDYFEDPVLLIKSAWGGRSLHTNFLSPSSKAYPAPHKDGDTGFQYAEVLRHVKVITGDMKKYYPDYTGQGYELVGFGWHQGWNDRIDQKAVDVYEKNMVNFIKDIRKDLGIKKMPFVIANTGMGGWNIPDKAPYKKKVEKHMAAQLAPADPQKYPEFKGNVAGVETRDFQRPREESPSGQDYHWYRNWETLYLIGKGMGDSMVELVSGNVPVATVHSGTGDTQGARAR